MTDAAAPARPTDARSRLLALAHALRSFDGARTSAIESPWRHRPALLALAPLLLVVLAILVAAPWYSNMNVDTMTFMEQVRAVAHGGSIGFENGPVEQYTELRTRWFVGAHGRAWGILPATISYVLAPAMALGGFRGTIRALWLLFAAAIVLTYALTYRLTRRPGVAVAAAYAMGGATSLGMWGIALAPFIPAATFGIASVYLAHRAFDRGDDTTRSALLAGGSGLASSVALGAHLLWSAPWAAGAGVFVLFGRPAHRVARAAAYLAASAPSLLLMAYVNHMRFGTWNPVSYGPCDSDSCSPRANNQTAAEFFNFVRPVLPYAIVFALALWVARRSARATGMVVGMGALAALLPEVELHARLHTLLRTLWGYVVDVGNLNISLPKGDHDLGSFVDGWCAKGLLQCSPFLAAALLARWPERDRARSPGDRPTVLLLGGVTLGLLALCMLRANTGGFNAYGYPFVNFRYVAPALPAMTVLAFLALQRLPLRAWHAPVALAVALWIGAFFARDSDDHDYTRRLVIHFVPLGLALALFVALAAAQSYRGLSGELARHAAALLLALCVGYGGAVVYGIDRVVGTQFRAPQNDRAAQLARCTPRRFILLGGFAMDEALAIHDRRDIYFINVGMGPRDGRNARTLVDQAIGPDRPAFLIEDDPSGPWHFNWAGFEFRPLPGCPLVRQIVRTTGG